MYCILFTFVPLLYYLHNSDLIESFLDTMHKTGKELYTNVFAVRY